MVGTDEYARTYYLFPDLALTSEISYTPESRSDGRRHHQRHFPSDSKSTSPNSQSIEENHQSYLHARKKSTSRLEDRSPSPATHIDQLRRVLAGAQIPHVNDIPKIEVNGEKMAATPASELESPEIGDNQGDLTLILDSLGVNGEWKEKSVENDEIESGIRPPYGL